MARTSRKRGAVEAARGSLYLRIYWRSPTNPLKEYRWKISTGAGDTPAAREQLEQKLDLINARIAGGALA